MSKVCLQDGLMIRLAPPTIADSISPACKALQAMSRHVRDDEHAVLSVMLSSLSAENHNVRGMTLRTEIIAPGAPEVILVRDLICKQIVSIASDPAASRL